MLKIKDQYHIYDSNLWDKNIPAFDVKNCELTTVPLGYFGPLVTDLEQIAQNINALVIPIYRSIDIFYHLFRNIEKINELIKFKDKKILINTQRFIPYLRPSSQELKEKLWAVHASDYLWPDGVMRPIQKALQINAPLPTISLTVHFTLGEMVRPHSTNLNWDKRCKFAILVPLADLPQLVNIHPYDSFIHGAWKISSRAILVIPKGTIVPDVYLKQGVTVVVYDSDKTSLRSTIKTQISRNGVYLKMSQNLCSRYGPAYLYGNKQINIINKEFFQQFLEENPHISFGGEIASCKGLGYCFGFMRQMSLTIFKNILRDEAYPYLEFAYEKIKANLTEQEQEKVLNFLKKYPPLNKLDVTKTLHPVSSDFVRNLNYAEFQEFKLKYPDLFTKLTEFISDANWAVSRWLLVGREQGLKENLENICRDNLNRFLEMNNLLYTTDITHKIVASLESQSERSELALYILNLEEVRRYNDRIILQLGLEKQKGWNVIFTKAGFFVPKYCTDSVKSVLPSYSEFYFQKDNGFLQTIHAIQDYRVINTPDSEKLYLLLNLPVIKIETNEEILLNSYSNLSYARKMLIEEDICKELYEKEIRHVRYSEGSALYQWRHYSIQILWRKLNLEKEFKELFPDDALFWESKHTFVEIYRKLKAMRTLNSACHEIKQ